MPTIESLHSLVRELRTEIAVLRKQKAEDDIERKRLMALIEAKDKYLHQLT